MTEGTCDHCGAHIHLIKTGVATYKWVTNPQKPATWKCGYDHAFPLRAHAPTEAGGEDIMK